VYAFRAGVNATLGNVKAAIADYQTFLELYLVEDEFRAKAEERIQELSEDL